MADGYGPALPLKRDEIDGYAMKKTIVEETKQNFKILLLTNPGERIMDRNFGIGIKKFLFEPQESLLYDKIRKRIKKQLNQYLSHVVVEKIEFGGGDIAYSRMPEAIPANDLSIKIVYKIVTVGVTDTIEAGPTPLGDFTAR
jgi:phage baseplate assembly protein W